MLETPPDILITNYAMLEHVLLLPRNRALLKDADLRWLVLDELPHLRRSSGDRGCLSNSKVESKPKVCQPANLDASGLLRVWTLQRKDELWQNLLRIFSTNHSVRAMQRVITGGRELHPRLRETLATRSLTPEDCGLAWRRFGTPAQRRIASAGRRAVSRRQLE